MVEDLTVFDILVKVVGHRRGKFLHRIVVYFRRTIRIESHVQKELNNIFGKRGKYKFERYYSSESYGELWSGGRNFVVNKMTYTYTNWEKIEAKLVELKMLDHKIEFVDEHRIDLNTLHIMTKPNF